jgi:methyl-accepting chemotaxis protein
VRPAVLLASLVAALALVAAGCGGSDEPEASATVQWADEFCGAVSTWTDSLKQIGEQFTDLSSLNQDSVEEAVNDARKATDDMLDEIRGLGTPDTESGEEAKQAVDDLATELDGGIAEIEQTVEGIQGITGIPGAISTLTTTLTSMSQAVTTAASTLTSGEVGDELKSAFEQAPACDDLTSSSS